MQKPHLKEKSFTNGGFLFVFFEMSILRSILPIIYLQSTEHHQTSF